MTEPSLSSVHEPSTQRLALLSALADSLEQSQAALATTTPAKLDQHTARQQELCRQLRRLAIRFPEGTRTLIHPRLADDLQQTVGRVRDLNRKYAALLRRRRRTVDIFCRVLASSGTTYPAPKPLLRRETETGSAKE
ncbi:MAG: hypothetical protein WAL32_05155 [Terriglobales bacterium]